MIFWDVWYRIKGTRDGIKWFLQRVFRGYSDIEVWDISHSNAKWLIPRLKRLRIIANGLPWALKSEKEWDEILGKIITAFEMIRDEYSIGDKDNIKVVEEGLDLYRKYYLDLWD